jgi:hypothetical protein
LGTCSITEGLSKEFQVPEITGLMGSMNMVRNTVICYLRTSGRQQKNAILCSLFS